MCGFICGGLRSVPAGLRSPVRLFQIREENNCFVGRRQVRCRRGVVLEDDSSARKEGYSHKCTFYINYNLEQSQENLLFGSKPKFGADSFVYLNMKVKY